ncbi:uncharacterized protein LOC120082175 [Benincasa hispida]|uniref:uncharacterized protein LOC120082175 n=1 Tax=Benincasa hispida TaxID=102211 RepID=UPI001900491B|nr:uncharacterized protein LOC120082175 [Benincasa hispida]
MVVFVWLSDCGFSIKICSRIELLLVAFVFNRKIYLKKGSSKVRARICQRMTSGIRDRATGTNHMFPLWTKYVWLHQLQWLLYSEFGLLEWQLIDNQLKPCLFFISSRGSLLSIDLFIIAFNLLLLI